MKYYKFIEPSKDWIEAKEIIKSEKQIIDEYFEYWSSKMIEIGREDLISKENCILDWVAINLAKEYEC